MAPAVKLGDFVGVGTSPQSPTMPLYLNKETQVGAGETCPRSTSPGQTAKPLNESQAAPLEQPRQGQDTRVEWEERRLGLQTPDQPHSQASSCPPRAHLIRL